ncbi:hypothetical protein HDU77_011377 [Chytriomyces hyalinus]|nr:hypothetical protein HDU77_011377 [Chytriomyces hyalinus]
MGNDGGSIPKRHELVTLKAKAERPDKDSQTEARWQRCALSKEPLREPIVACRLGRLYNKESVIEHLMDRTKFGDGDEIAGHLQSLKDVTVLKLTKNPSYNQSEVDELESGAGGGGSAGAKYICPVSLKDFNGKLRFVYSLVCGCVVAEAAVKQLSADSCLGCGADLKAAVAAGAGVAGGEFSSAASVWVVVNSTVPEEIARMRASVEAIRIARAEALAAKKAAKKAKSAVGATGGNKLDAGKKRKEVDDADGSQQHSKLAKKQAASQVSNARANISIPLPLELEKKTSSAELSKNQSDAIKSLYSKDKDKPKGNYLTMGTFNRYTSY